MSNEYGTITFADGRMINIENFSQMEFKDSRLCSIVETAENTFLLSIENPKSTGRATNQEMYLTPETLYGLIATAMFHFDSKGVNLKKLIEESIEGNMIKCRTSFE